MQLIGILNLTPDSFSDGGQNSSPELALAKAQELISQGAAYIDVGAESTRPGAEPVTAAEEWGRLAPFLNIADFIPLSLDTRNYKIATTAFIYSQIKILNDVSGFNDPRMVQLAVKYNADIIAMHSLSVPANKNIVLQAEPVATLKEWINTKFKALTAAGITQDHIIFDVGLGFGKTAAQSWELVENAAELAHFCHKLGTRILYGHSRKSFLKAAPGEEDSETAKITARLAAAGVDFARVHAIKPITNGELPL